MEISPEAAASGAAISAGFIEFVLEVALAAAGGGRLARTSGSGLAPGSRDAGRGRNIDPVSKRRKGPAAPSRRPPNVFDARISRDFGLDAPHKTNMSERIKAK
jgi:hypothetical protein